MGRSVSTIPWQPWQPGDGLGSSLACLDKQELAGPLPVLLPLLLPRASTNPLALPLAPVFSCRMCFSSSPVLSTGGFMAVGSLLNMCALLRQKDDSAL